MESPRTRLVLPLALAAILLCGGALFVGARPAQAQCLSQGECDALKDQLKDLKKQTRADRQEARDIKRQARALPKGSSERQALRDQIRELRKTAKDRRREARPLRESFLNGCRNC